MVDPFIIGLSLGLLVGFFGGLGLATVLTVKEYRQAANMNKKASETFSQARHEYEIARGAKLQHYQQTRNWREIERQMEIANKVMHEDRNLLRELAKR